MPLRRHARLGRQAALGALLVAAAVVVSVAVPPLAVGAVSGQTLTLLVDSAEFLGSDAAKGDGVCATATGVCTLRAAVEEANALGAANTVTIAPAPLITDTDGIAKSDVTIVANDTPSAWMSTASVTTRANWDAGAYYRLTAKMTIDLGNRVSLRAASGAPPYAVGFFVDAANVTLRHFTDVYTNSISIFAGPNASNAVIEGGRAVQWRSNWARRYLLIQPGAKNVAFRDYTVGRMYSQPFANGTGAEQGIGSVVLDSRGGTAAVSGLTIQRVVFDNTPGPGECDAADSETGGMTCGSPGIIGVNNVVLGGPSITSNTFRGFGPQRHPINLYSVAAGDGPAIQKNTFTANSVGTAREDALVVLKGFSQDYGAPMLTGNTFDGTGGVQGVGLYFYGPGTAATMSGYLFATDNYFNAMTVNSIVLANAGVAIARQNTFGPDSASQPRTTTMAQAEETVNYPSSALMTNDASSNGKLNTWYPTAVSQSGCSLSVTVKKPSSPPASAAGARPVVYVYWTADRTAELFLGYASIDESKDTQTVTIAGGGGKFGQGGYIRVQSARSTTNSGAWVSQFSRLLAAPTQADTCAPTVTLNQAATQADPTSGRRIAFTVVGSEALADLVPADFSLTGSTAPGHRVVEVQRVSATSFTVWTMADASGDIVLSLPADAAHDLAGNAAPQATSTDNRVTYVSPLTREPASAALDEGGPGVDLTVTRVASLAPASPVFITGTSADPRVRTNPAPLVMEGAAVTVRAVILADDDGVVAPDQEASLAYTVTSADPNFDGLLLPQTSLAIHDTSLPTEVTLVKRAWTDVLEEPGGTTHDAIIAQATEIPSGSRVIEGTKVWWTYTVENSGGTLLSSLDVVDSVLGDVCFLASLAPGATAGCVASGLVESQP
jgi:adhesin/invasin